MAVFKNDSTGRWYFSVRINGKQYKRENKEWTLKRHAVEAEDAFIEEYKDKKMQIKNITFEEGVDLYLGFMKLNRKLSTTDRVERSFRRHITPFFKDRKIRDITTADIEAFQLEVYNKKRTINGEEVPYSNSAIYAMQSNLNSMLRYLTSRRYIQYNPFDPLEIVQRKEVEDKEPQVILSYEQFSAFIDTLDDQMYRTLYSLLYWTAIRIGEAMALNIGDYIRETKQLHVTTSYDNQNKIVTTTKTGIETYISLPDECIQEIEKLLDLYENKEAIYNQNSPLLGLTKRLAKTSIDNDRKQHIKNANQELKDAGKDIRIPYFTWHDLRHTHISTLIDLGFTTFQISQRTGQTEATISKTYGHLFPSVQEEMIDKLNDLSVTKS